MEITYTVSIEDENDVTPEESFATDEPELDAATCREIRRRLAHGDTWAWCMVTVTAEVTVDGERFTGRDHLGGCSYDNEAEFTAADGYYPDMCAAALDDLRVAMRHAALRGDAAARGAKLLPE